MFKAHMRNVRPNEANTKYFEFVKNSQRNAAKALGNIESNRSNKSGNISSKLFNSVGISNFNSMKSLNQSSERNNNQIFRKDQSTADHLIIKPKLSKKKIKTYRKYLLSPEQKKDLNNLKSSMNEKQQLVVVDHPIEPDSIDSECSGVLHSSTNCEKAQKIPCFQINQIMPSKVEFTVHQDLKNYCLELNSPHIHREEVIEESHPDNLEMKLKSDRSQAKVPTAASSTK